jgi:hypothetical protein
MYNLQATKLCKYLSKLRSTILFCMSLRQLKLSTFETKPVPASLYHFIDFDHHPVADQLKVKTLFLVLVLPTHIYSLSKFYFFLYFNLSLVSLALHYFYFFFYIIY